MHEFGWKANGAVEKARKQVANLLNCEDNEITFNSGSSEGLNYALKGLYEKFSKHKNHIITVKTEHVAVYETCKYLELKGAEVTYLDVDKDGKIDIAQLKASIRPETFLASIMIVNNETGVVQDMKAISDVCKDQGVILMSDATQAIGKVSLDVQALGIDITVISAHKIYGPKGVGALYARRKSPRVSILPLMHGGSQEEGKRAGTLNVPGIVGLGKACEMAKTNINYHPLSSKLEQALIALGCKIIGHFDDRVGNVVNVCVGINLHEFLKPINSKIAVLLGSACSSVTGKPSRVLTAMGLNSEEMKQCMRISLGKYTTSDDVDRVIKIFQEALK